MRRLGSHDWFTRDGRERYYIRRDAAEVLSSSTNPRARAFAVECLARKPNLAVLDECFRELLESLRDADPGVAKASAELINACVQDGISISKAGQISGVCMTPSGAEKYAGELQTYVSDSTVHEDVRTLIEETMSSLMTYLKKKQPGTAFS